MSSIYDIDYRINIQQLYPTHKRLTNLLNRAYSLFGDQLNILETIFTYFRTGATCGNYSDSTTYVFGNMVVYQRRVYYKNEYFTDYAAGITPINDKYWIKVLDDFIGIDEKVYFGPQKIVLEYALNRIFQTTFRQREQAFDSTTSYPDTSKVLYGTHNYQRNSTTAGYSVGTLPTNTTYWTDLGFGLPDIYIVNNNTTETNFNIGIDDTESSTISLNDADSDYAISIDDGDTSVKDFTVFVPSAVLAALSSDPTNQKAIISSAVNKYRLSGFLFDVQGY